MTEQGTIRTECVINSGGMWGRQVGEMVHTPDGAPVNLPLTPLGHQHLLAGVPDFTFPKNTPCLRDPENLVYLREEVGGLVIGGFESEPVAWAMDGVPWDFTQQLLAPDWELFAPIMEGAMRRIPMLEHADAVELVHGPESITPDSKPLLGPVPGVPGFWAACGFRILGLGQAQDWGYFDALGVGRRAAVRCDRIERAAVGRFMSTAHMRPNAPRKRTNIITGCGFPMMKMNGKSRSGNAHWMRR